MNKFYIIVPLLLCLVFGGFYYQFDKDYNARQEAKQAAAQAELKEKQRHDLEARQAAYQAALEAQNQRKAEREEKERIEAEKKQTRINLEDQRQRAFDDRRRLREELDRTKKEVASVEEEVAKLGPAKKAYQDELVFLKDYVMKAKANVNRYYDLLDKISAAEDAAAKAAALAATAKK